MWVRAGCDVTGAEPASELVIQSLTASVLVVEDDGIVATDIADALTRFGYSLAGRASTGVEATQKAELCQPDLVLMDVRLRGGMDGISAAQEILRRRRVPLVFLTASSDPSTIKRALAIEPFGYLVKPFREAELRATIELALCHHRAGLAAQERATRWSELSVLDELTQLHNRRGFLMQAAQQMHLARRENRSLTLFFADLDGLKRINDERGHNQGDLAIQTAAQVLRHTFRESDVVARLAGDEFAVLSLDGAQHTAQRVMERLQTNLCQCNATSGLPFRIEMSVGCAVREGTSDESIECFIARADANMYVNKRRRGAKR